MDINIQLVNPDLAEKICRQLTAILPEWFGIPEANERYAKGCLERTSIAASMGNDYIGLIVLEFPFAENANIYWMAVAKTYHGQGIGKMLLQAAENYCIEKGIMSITVETLSPKHQDEHYLKTYQFYQAHGFKPLFELQPYGPDHSMCYLGKIHLQRSSSEISTKLSIRAMTPNDVKEIVRSFEKLGWDKPPALFQGYLADANRGERFVWVASYNNQFAGYVTLYLKSAYIPFQVKQIPEINDLNVLPEFRNKGIGSALLVKAENQAKALGTNVGIGVGLYPDYGAAQRLYVKRGYLPDGKGVTYQHQDVVPGKEYCLDDDLNLWFIKEF